MRTWVGYISTLFSLKLSYMQIFFLFQNIIFLDSGCSDFQITMNKIHGVVILKIKKNTLSLYIYTHIYILPLGQFYVIYCRKYRIKQLKQNQDEQSKKIYYYWIFLYIYFIQENRKIFVNSYFQIPLLALPHPCRHIVYSFTHYLGTMKTGSRERNICKLLVTSTTPTAMVLCPQGSHDISRAECLP